VQSLLFARTRAIRKLEVEKGGNGGVSTHTHTQGGLRHRSVVAGFPPDPGHPSHLSCILSVGLSPRRRSLHLRSEVIDTRTTTPELYIHINQTHARSRRLVGLAILATATGVVIDVRKSRGRPPAERPCRPSRSCTTLHCPA
jgi:hypothetical protein